MVGASSEKQMTSGFQSELWNLPAGDHGCSLSLCGPQFHYLVSGQARSEKGILQISSTFELVLEPHDGIAKERLWTLKTY